MKSIGFLKEDCDLGPAGKILWTYEGAPTPEIYARQSSTEHLQVPAELDADCVVAAWIADAGEGESFVAAHWEIQEDAGKVAAKLLSTREGKLSSLRSLRQPKLDEADAGLNKHSDSDTSAVGTVGAWQTYRIALRGVTDAYKNHASDSGHATAVDALVVASFTWPTKP